MRINNHNGLFDIAMGNYVYRPSELNLELIEKMVEAENAFEQSMGHLVRTDFREVDNSESILASLVNSWKCVLRARMEAGY